MQKLILALAASAPFISSCVTHRAVPTHETELVTIPEPPPVASAPSPFELSLAAAPFQQEEPDTWDVVIEPYALLASIEGDAALGSVGGDVDVDFGDILESLELGAMLHFEAYHENGWGFMLDYAFMDLGAENSGPVGAVVDVGIYQGVLEAMLSRRYEMSDGSVVDAFGGVRWWDINLDTDITPGPVALNRDVDWFDAVVGAKAITPISGKWYFRARGDLGGFGLESDFTWNLKAGFQYRPNDSFGLELQYQALGVDYSEDEGTTRAFRYDSVTHGPLIGFSFYL